MRTKFEMFSRRGNPDKLFDQFEEEEILGEGEEGEVKRVKLIHVESGQPLKGFVKKEFFVDDDPRYQEYRANVEDAFFLADENWKRIMSLVKERQREGRDAFQIPGTVRPYVDEDGHFGFIMTDLSKGGVNEVVSLSELHQRLFNDPDYVSDEEWKKIKQHVDRDLRIAEEEQISLGGGNLGLDPWMVTKSPSGSFEVWLADVGRFVRFDASQELVERRNSSKRNGLEVIEELIDRDVDARTFWDRYAELEEGVVRGGG